MKRLFFLGLLLALTLVVAPHVLAQASPANGSQVQFSHTIFGDGKTYTSGAYFQALYLWAVGIGVIAAALSIIRAGYIYTTGRGNPSSISSAKEIIINALVGLALLILSYTILRFLIGQRVQPASPPSSNSQSQNNAQQNTQGQSQSEGGGGPDFSSNAINGQHPAE